MTYIFKLLGLFVGAVTLYVALAFFCEWLPGENKQPKNKETIFIYQSETTPSHTAIIMRVETFKKAFKKAFPTLIHADAYGYISFSYGDRDFMMDEGGFDNINLILALRGLFLNTPALIKVGHYAGIKKSLKLSLSKEALDKLKTSILDSFAKKKGRFVRYHDRYNYDDTYYYEAKTPYNLFHTCNTWTGDRLREAGVWMPCWTPFAENVISQLD